MQHKHFKKILFLFWILCIAFFFLLYSRSDITLTTCPDAICGIVAYAGFVGPLIFIVLFVLRTLTFFSVTVFVVAAGALFSPAQAILYTIVGINLSALLSFAVGRYFGRDVIKRASKKIAYMPTGKAFRRNGLMSVMTMYLLFVPFDWVGYIAGAYGVKMRDMAIGAFFGTLPGLIAFVFLGGALKDPLRALPLFITFFLLGIGIAQIFKYTPYGKNFYRVEGEGVH